MEYRRASRDFDAFIVEARDELSLTTTNQAYAVVWAVLHVFRDHLELKQALSFAQVLPPVLRAIFIDGWIPVEDPQAFPSRTELIREVRSVRGDHNPASDSAIGDVAKVLRRHVDETQFDAVLATFPEQAWAYWKV